MRERVSEAVKVVVLETGIFPDRETLEEALDRISATHPVWRFECGHGRTEAEWDLALERLLAADRIIVV